MTLLVAWAGFDSHGCTSAYIASDSRISFSNNQKYDYGKKVFSCKKYPEIFGFVGDAIFPSYILQQIVEMIDDDLIINQNMSCVEKNKMIFDKISNGIKEYKNISSCSTIQIIHITRRTREIKTENNKIVYPKFYIHELTYYPKTKKWDKKRKELSIINSYSVFGSGKKEYLDKLKIYNEKENRNTSRIYYQCFCDVLENSSIKTIGGAPQLVGIERKPNTGGINYGVIYKNKRFYSGIEVPKSSNFDRIKWRNEKFEIANGISKKRNLAAKAQPNLVRGK